MIWGKSFPSVRRRSPSFGRYPSQPRSHAGGHCPPDPPGYLDQDDESCTCSSSWLKYPGGSRTEGGAGGSAPSPSGIGMGAAMRGRAAGSCGPGRGEVAQDDIDALDLDAKRTIAGEANREGGRSVLIGGVFDREE
jgi:hypothetical protein